MANWQVPNFAALINNLNDQIASPPDANVRGLIGDPIGGFLKARKEAQDYQQEAALQDAFKNLPKTAEGDVDYGGIAQRLFQNNNPVAGLKMLELGQKQKTAADERRQQEEALRAWNGPSARTSDASPYTGPGIAAVAAEGATPDLAGVAPHIQQGLALAGGSLGSALNITSGYRDPVRNARAGGVAGSEHIGRNAVDIRSRDMTPAQIAATKQALEAQGFSVLVESDHIHASMQPGAARFARQPYQVASNAPLPPPPRSWEIGAGGGGGPPLPPPRPTDAPVAAGAPGAAQVPGLPSFAQGPAQTLFGGGDATADIPAPGTAEAQSGGFVIPGTGVPALGPVPQPQETVRRVQPPAVVDPEDKQGGPYKDKTTNQLLMGLRIKLPDDEKRAIQAEINRRAQNVTEYNRYRRTRGDQIADQERQRQLALEDEQRKRAQALEDEQRKRQQTLEDKDPQHVIRDDGVYERDRKSGEWTRVKSIPAKAAENPAEIKEYLFYRGQELDEGRTPKPYGEWRLEGKKAGAASTTVTVGQEPPDATLRKKLDEETAKEWSKHQEAGVKAAGAQQDMQALGELLTMAPQGPVVGRLANTFRGFSNAADAANSIIKRVAPTLRVTGSGSTSDIEYQGMLDGMPNLISKEGANQVIMATMQAKNAINIERADVISQFRRNKISQSDAEEKLNELNKRSIMTPELTALMRSASGLPATTQPAGRGQIQVDDVTRGLLDKYGKK